MREEFSGLLRELHEMGKEAEGCLSLLISGFMSNASAPLKECREKTESLQQKGTAITMKIAEEAQGKLDLKGYLSVPSHLQRIFEETAKLTDLIEKKSKEKVLFSDRAVTEITFLLQRLMDIFRPTFDIILVRNSILSRYVSESEAEIAKAANEYATQHEERLIEGLCIPVASSLYLAMLDTVKGIAWHAKEIAVRLTE